MNKYLYLIACTCIAIASCDTTGGGGTTGPALKPDEQKIKVEETAVEIMDIMDSKDYKDLVQSASVFYKALEEFDDPNYDFSELEEVAGQIYGESFQWEEVSSDKCAITLNLFLANAKGLVTIGDGKVTYQEYDGTKVVWTDDSGNVWTAEISQSGNVKTMDFDTFVQSGVYIDGMTTSYWDENHTHTYDITIGVPEKVTAYMSRNGEKLAEVTVDLNINFSADDVEIRDDIPYIKKGSVSVSTNVKVADLNLTISPLSYNVTTGQFQFSETLYKGSQLLLKTSASASGKVYDILETEDYTVKNVNISADLLGKVQVSLTCPDVAKLVEYIENIDPDSEKEEWETAVAKLNSSFDAVLRFDGTSNVQASLEFESVEYYDEEFDEKYYRMALVLGYNDGSRHSLDEIYSDKDMDRIEGLKNDFEYWAGTYVSLIQSYFGEDFL